MDDRFQGNSKFALVAGHNAFTEIFQTHPSSSPIELGSCPECRPSTTSVPWKEWLGSIRLERLGDANLVLLAEEPSENPVVLDGVHRQLSDDLGLLFWALHLQCRRWRPL